MTWGDSDLADTGSNLGSLTLAIADLKAIDARLTTLAAADPPIKSDGADLTAKILESQALVRAAIALLSGARMPAGTVTEAQDTASGGAKRRVKIKAASDSTAATTPATTKSPSKAGTRGGDRARSAETAMVAAPAAPRNSLLARLGAATSEPAASTSPPAAAVIPAPSPAGALDAAERLARLEAEIDSLTEASTTGNRRGKSTAPEMSAPQSEPKVAEAVSAAPAKVTRASDLDSGATDDDDDAEIVIVGPDGASSGAQGRGASYGRHSPRALRDPPACDEDAEVEIMQPGAGGRMARVSPATASDRAKAGAEAKPVAPTKWRLFRGS